jgi:hypothetical protein
LFSFQLKKSWFFDCTCSRCSDPTDFGTFTSSPKCLDCSRKPDQTASNQILPDNSESDRIKPDHTGSNQIELDKTRLNQILPNHTGSNQILPDFTGSQEGLFCPENPLDHNSTWKCNLCSKIVKGQKIEEIEKKAKEVVANIQDNSKIVEAIEELEKIVSPAYHLILVLKLKFISTHFEEKRLNELKVKYCQSILPALQKLEGGHSPVIGQVAKELSKVQISMLTDDMKAKKISNAEYLKKIKPFILLQMEAKKWSP